MNKCPAVSKMNFANALDLSTEDNIYIGFLSNSFQPFTLVQHRFLFKCLADQNQLCSSLSLSNLLNHNDVDPSYSLETNRLPISLESPNLNSGFINENVHILLNLNYSIQNSFQYNDLSQDIEKETAFMNLSENGRNNNGIPIFSSAFSKNLSPETRSRYVNLIGLSSCEHFNQTSLLSSYLPYILVNAPTIRTIQPDSKETDNKNNFNDQDSSNAAFAAAVTALMLQVNPKLTWRDIQYILSLTATVNDFGHGVKWQKNAADIYYSPLYGFGRINAELAVQTAQNWKNVPPEKLALYSYSTTFPLPHSLEDPLIIAFDSNLNSLNKLSSEIDKTIINTVEFVEVSFQIRSNFSTEHLYDGLVVQLESPSGTNITLQYPKSHLSVKSGKTVSLGTRGFFLEKSEGIWKIKMKTMLYNPNLEVSNISLKIYGNEKDIGSSAIIKTLNSTDNKFEFRNILREDNVPGLRIFKCQDNTFNNDTTLSSIDLRNKTEYETKYFKYYNGNYYKMNEQNSCLLKDQLEGQFIYINNGNQAETILDNVIFENPHNNQFNIPTYYQFDNKTKSLSLSYYRQALPNYLGINQNNITYGLYINDPSFKKIVLSGTSEDNGIISFKRKNHSISIENSEIFQDFNINKFPNQSVLSIAILNDDIYQCPLIFPFYFNRNSSKKLSLYTSRFALRIKPGNCTIPNNIIIEKNKINYPDPTEIPQRISKKNIYRNYPPIFPFVIFFAFIFFVIIKFKKSKDDEKIELLHDFEKDEISNWDHNTIADYESEN